VGEFFEGAGEAEGAAAGDKTTTYLYGAELSDAWAYSLPDGTNIPRQKIGRCPREGHPTASYTL
jgi:hypothetical protein